MNKVKIISLIRSELNIGKSITRQKFSYTEEEELLIAKIIEFLDILSKYINWSFGGSFFNDQLIKALIRGYSDKKISVVSVFCPSYKVGVGECGYNSKIGNSTRRNIDFLITINDTLSRYGISTSFNIYFSDILLENYDLLRGVNYRDQLESNYIDLINNTPSNFRITKLSDLGTMLIDIGERGPSSCILDIDARSFDVVYARNHKFYMEVLGWSDESVRARTSDLARAYPYIARQLNTSHPKSILYWSESAIERVLLMPNLELPVLVPRERS